MGHSAPGPEAAATDELYGLDPAEFVSARNELVRRLRTEGQRDLAKRVAELRRPSPAAWAVNQLARRHRGALDELLALGDTLRRAQTQTLAGADAALLRQAGRARREAVASLADSAVGLLSGRGLGGAHRTEISATLEAASLDPQAGAEVSAGRLTSALEPPSGFGHLDLDVDQPTAGGTPSAAGRQRPEPTEKDPSTAGADPSAAEADPSAAEVAELLAEAERVASATAKRAADLSEKANQATALAARRQREVADAEADEGRLQRDLDEARGRVVAGRRSADRAQKAAVSAEAAAAEADDRRRDAEQRVADLRATRSG